MRVAFQHTDPEHPNHGVAAYKLGRVHDFTHPVTGEQASKREVVLALLEQARDEFPESEGYRVWPECFVDEDGEGRWEELDEDALRGEEG